MERFMDVLSSAEDRFREKERHPFVDGYNGKEPLKECDVQFFEHCEATWGRSAALDELHARMRRKARG